MYTSSNKQYIFRQSSGRILNFYNDRKEGLCYSVLRSRSTWSTPTVISKNAALSFCADMDPGDRFHLVYQDKEGNLYYTILSNAPLHTIPILRSKLPTAYDKNPSLLVNGNIIHFFFLLQHNEKLLLSHQLLDGDTAPTPKVIDYVSKGEFPYSTVIDRLGNIFCFYCNEIEGTVQIGYRKFNNENKTWSEFITVSAGSMNCGTPHSLADSRNVIHLMFQRSISPNLELVYKQKVAGKDQWSEEAIIHTSARPFGEFSLAMINKALTAFWIKTDEIYFSTSTNEGIGWTKPSRYNFYAGRQLFCIAYKSNLPDEQEKIFAKELPGGFINGIKMCFYNIPPDHPSPTTPEDLKAMIVDSLKMLRDSVEELREARDKSDEDYMGLGRDIEELKKELDKAAIRLEIAESSGNLQKNSVRNELLKNNIEDLGAKLDTLTVKVAEIEKKIKIMEDKVKTML